MDIFWSHAFFLIPALIALGCLAGFLAGLLGVGGGIVLVPGFYFLFHVAGYPPAPLMHLAVGTSLAIIIPTGLSSVWAHYRRGHVRTDLLRYIVPGIIAGVIAGTLIAKELNGAALTLFFAIALFLLAGLMLIPPNENKSETKITPVKGTGAGVVVGAISALMGIGGATLNVPFLTRHGLSIHAAVATSSAIGPFIALPGAIGFALIGQDASGLPPFSIGYVSLLAMTIIAPASILCAPLGAATAYRCSVRVLRWIFAGFVVLVALKMMFDAIDG